MQKVFQRRYESRKTPEKLPHIGSSDRSCSKTLVIEEEGFLSGHPICSGAAGVTGIVRGITYRLSRSGERFEVSGLVKKGFELELHRLPTLVVLGALHCPLR